MTKNKLLLLLALLMTAATGAMAADTYTVAGSNSAMFGFAWDPTYTANDMTKNGDGTYSITYTNVNFTEPEEVQYKVVKNHSWGEAYPEVNRVINIAKAGTYTVTIHFNPTTHEVYETMPGSTTGYTVTLADGTEDADKWTISPASAAEGETVTVTYTGSKKVIGVKAEKKAADPAKAYLKWDADQKKLVATEIPTTAIKVENADAEVNWSAGTYVVEGEVTINGMIKLNGDVDLIIKDGAKLTAKKISGSGNNLRIYGQAQMSGELVVNHTNGDAIMNIGTLEVHSAQVTAASSANSCGGIYGISTFNVYGGLVDAKGTGAGYGISLNGNCKMNIHGGEVKAEGKGTGGYSYGIRCGNTATVTVFGGKLWAGNADKKALTSNITITKGEGFSGKIEYSSDKSTWSETVDANAKYVRAGY